MKNMKRILLKLSGEALSGEKGFGFDEATCLEVSRTSGKENHFTPGKCSHRLIL